MSLMRTYRLESKEISKNETHEVELHTISAAKMASDAKVDTLEKELNELLTLNGALRREIESMKDEIVSLKENLAKKDHEMEILVKTHTVDVSELERKLAKSLVDSRKAVEHAGTLIAMSSPLHFGYQQ